MVTFQLLRFAAPRTAAGRVLSWAPGAPAPPAPRGAEQSASPRSPKRPRNAPRARGARSALPVRRVPVSSAATSSSWLVRDSEMRGVTIRLHLPQSRLPGRPQPGAVAVPSHDPRPQTHVCGPHPAPTLRIGAPRGLTDGATGPSDERLSAQHVRPELTSGLPHRRRPICLAVLRDGMSGVASCEAQSLGITPGFSFFRLVISRLEVALTLLSTHTRKPTQPSPSHHSL